MAPRITIVGGGSYQWAPKLLVDLANTPALHEAEVVLHDVDPEPLPAMAALGAHIAATRGIGLTVSTTTDRGEALDGAHYVVVTISTGGFASMRHDLDIPAAFGIRQPVGDTVGPGGILRAQRAIPVLLDIARDMETRCPHAWLLNLTNPMTTLCRAVTRETSVRTVGLCHEATIAQYLLSLLFAVPFFEITLTIGGVNHLPLATAVDVGGRDGLELLGGIREACAGADGEVPLTADVPDGLELRKLSTGERWTRRDLVANWGVRLDVLARYGAFPAAGDRHVAEFFSDYLTEATGWGRDLGVRHATIADREAGRRADVAALRAMLASDRVPTMPSGEMVAPLVHCLEQGQPGVFPVNLPNAGQMADVAPGAVVETMCTVADGGLRPRDTVRLPTELAAHVRRVCAAQERTVDAAVNGDRTALVDAMTLDPLASRLDPRSLAAMTDEMLRATASWLPQYARV